MSGEATTDPIQISTCKVEWIVKKSAFDTPLGSYQFIKSKEFEASPDSTASWQLKLYPRGDTKVTSEHVSLFLIAPTVREPVRVKYTLGLIASDGTEKNTININNLFSKPEWWGFGEPTFIKRDKLLDPTQKFFRDGQLTIFCDLKVLLSPEVHVPECTLSNEWSELVDSGDFSDVVFVVGEEEIKAHKLVLSARCPIFAEMFKENMTENQTDRVLIEDLDVVGVRALLSFLYSGEVKDLKAIADKVLPAADKYGVEPLKTLCEREICKMLIIENAVEILSLAELHNARQLKAQALSFISLNAAEVLEQDGFWELPNTNLVREAVRFSNSTMRTEHSEGSQESRRKLN